MTVATEAWTLDEWQVIAAARDGGISLWDAMIELVKSRRPSEVALAYYVAVIVEAAYARRTAARRVA